MHMHPQINAADQKASATQSTKANVFCGIEIMNNSQYSVHVSGVFDDNARLGDFDVFPYEAPHFIDLFYYGYCHASMYINIQSNVYPYSILYQGQTSAGSTLRIYNSLSNSVQVEAVRK